MTRPPITWIHVFTYGDDWTVVIERLGQDKRSYYDVGYYSRDRLADLVSNLGRPHKSSLPRLVTRPQTSGWCAYPDPEIPLVRAND